MASKITLTGLSNVSFRSSNVLYTMSNTVYPRLAGVSAGSSSTSTVGTSLRITILECRSTATQPVVLGRTSAVPLNSLLASENEANVTLDSATGQFTVPSGTYLIDAATGLSAAARARVLLRDMTTAGQPVVKYGTTVAAVLDGSISRLLSRVRFAKTTTLRLEVQSDSDTTILSYVGGFTGDATGESFAQVLVYGVADALLTQATQVAFYAYYTPPAGSQANATTTSAGGVIPFNTTLQNTGSGFSTSTYTFVAPYGGAYYLYFLLFVFQSALTQDARASLYWRSGSTTTLVAHVHAGNDYTSLASSVVLVLAVGDQVFLTNEAASPLTLDLRQGHSYFGGYYIGMQSVPTEGLISSTGQIPMTGALPFARTGAGLPALGSNGGVGDRLVLMRGSPSAYPASLGVADTNGSLWYSAPSVSATHAFYVNGAQKFVITGTDASLSNGMLTASRLAGDGALVSNLSAANVSAGVLPVKYGGIGASNLTLNSLLIGNGSQGISAPSGLTWDAGTSTLSAFKLTGDGALVSNLSAANVSAGVLPVKYGGIGASNLTLNSLLVGNGSQAVLAPSGLTWDSGTSILSATGLSTSSLTGPSEGINVTSDLNMRGRGIDVDGSKIRSAADGGLEFVIPEVDGTGAVLPTARKVMKFNRNGNISFAARTVDAMTGATVSEAAAPLLIAGTAAGGASTSAHLVPDTNAAYDLGSSAKAWKNLYLSGSAYISYSSTETSTGTPPQKDVSIELTVGDFTVLKQYLIPRIQQQYMDYITSTTSAYPNRDRILPRGDCGDRTLYIAGGNLYAVGQNRSSSMGLGSTEEGLSKFFMTQLTTSGDIVDVSCSERFTAYIRSNGTAMASGFNDYGQLGTGDRVTRHTFTQVNLPAGFNAKRVSAGGSFCLYLGYSEDAGGNIIDSTCEVYGFGDNSNGQLSDGVNAPVNTTARKMVMPAVPGQPGSTIVPLQISAGLNHTVVLDKLGTAWVSGSNQYGQLGYPVASYSLLRSLSVAGTVSVSGNEVSLQGHSKIIRASASYMYTVLVDTDGRILTVGRNEFGQLGTGNKTDRDTWNTLAAPSGTDDGIYMVVAAARTHLLFIKRGGTLWGVGSNANNRLGLTSSVETLTPSQVNTLGRSAIRLATGQSHSVAMYDDGRVYATGSNAFGQVGRGDNVTGTSFFARLDDFDTATYTQKKYPDVVLTSASQAGYTVTSTNAASKEGFRLFDANVAYTTASRWSTSGVAKIAFQGANVWHVTVTSPDRFVLRFYRLYQGGATNAANPLKWRVFGSNDGGTSWTLVDSREETWGRAIEASETYCMETFLTSSNNSAYNTYRLAVETVVSASSVELQEWELFEQLGASVPQTLGKGHAACLLYRRTQDSRIVVAGNNAMGTLGIGNEGFGRLTFPFFVYPDLRRYGDASLNNNTELVHVRFGETHATALDKQSRVWVWGNNRYRQLNTDVNVGIDYAHAMAREVAPSMNLGERVLKVDANQTASYILTSSGRVFRWGTDWSLTNGAPEVLTFPVVLMDMAAGHDHILGLGTDNRIYVLGKNLEGQLGVATNFGTSTPVNTAAQCPLIANVIRVFAGKRTSAALTAEGHVWVWGRARFNGGPSYSSVPYRLLKGLQPGSESMLVNIVHVACGDGFGLALSADNTVMAWGLNDRGQLGNGSTTYSETPVYVLKGEQATTFNELVFIREVSAHDNFGLARDTDGNVFVWGDNSFGQLAQNSATTSFSTPRMAKYGINDLRQNKTTNRFVSGQYDHAIVRRDTSTSQYFAFGSNTNGRLGNGATDTFVTVYDSPFMLAHSASMFGNKRVVSVSCGFDHTGAVTEDGAVWAWGANNNYACGLSGLGSTYSTPTKVDVVSISNAAKISCGYTHTLVLLNNGSVMGFGRNDYGQLGTGGTLTSQQEPIAMTLKSSVTVAEIYAGYNFSVVKYSDGEVHYCGRPASDTGSAIASLQNEASLKNATAISVAQHAAAVVSGELWVRGYNAFGELGVGNRTSQTSFVKVDPTRFGELSGSRNVLDVRAARFHTVILLMDGTLRTVGRNLNACLTGSTGIGADTTAWQKPDARFVYDIHAMEGSTLFKTFGRQEDYVQFYGRHDSLGRLDADYTMTGAFTRSLLGRHGEQWRSGKMGCDHTVILDAHGRYYSTGSGADGLLGAGNTTNRTSLTQAGYLERTVVALACGPAHTLVLNRAGNLSSFGANVDGQLGSGNTTSSSTPLSITVPRPVMTLGTSIATSPGWNILMRTDGNKNLITSTDSKFASPGSTSFRSATLASTGANSRLVIGDEAGVYPAFFLQKNITKIAIIDGSAGHVMNPAAHTNYVIYNLVESTGNESIYDILLRLDGVSIGSASSYTNPSVLNYTAGTNGYSGLMESSGGTAFRTTTFGDSGNTNVVPDKFCVAGFNLQLDVDSHVLCTYAGNLQSGKGDSWRGSNPSESFWSYWGMDFTNKISAGVSTYPGVATGSSYSGVVYLMAFTANTSVTSAVTAASPSSSCAVTDDGLVYAWGNNSRGQIGNGTTSSTPVKEPTQVTNSNITNVVQADMGAFHTLALKSDGTVWFWGDNTRGQRGDNTTSTSAVTTPSQVPGLTDVSFVACGAFFNICLKRDRTVWAWGDNTNGSLGLGDTTRRLVPTQITTLTNIVAVSCGVSHAIALNKDGVIYTWGLNTSGQVGSSSISISVSTPYTDASWNTDYIGVSAGAEFCHAIRRGGAVMAWGRNDKGQLGTGTTSASVTSPTSISLTDVTNNSSYINFTGQHRCFIKGVDPNNYKDYEGLCLIADQDDYRTYDRVGPASLTVNDSLPIVSLSHIARDKRVFGVLSTKSNSPLEGLPDPNDYRVQVNSVGEGAVWVCAVASPVNHPKPVHSGDYLTTSDVPGYAMLQTDANGDVDDVLRNFTVAKSTMFCDFSEAWIPKRKVVTMDNGEQQVVVVHTDTPKTQTVYTVDGTAVDGAAYASHKQAAEARFSATVTYAVDGQTASKSEYDNGLAQVLSRFKVSDQDGSEDGPRTYRICRADVTPGMPESWEEVSESVYREAREAVDARFSLTRSYAIDGRSVESPEYSSALSASSSRFSEQDVVVRKANGDIVYEVEMEPRYRIRYLSADGAIVTDRTQAKYVASFIGCSYHCG